jgi:hypothetical protein
VPAKPLKVYVGVGFGLDLVHEAQVGDSLHAEIVCYLPRCAKLHIPMNQPSSRFDSFTMSLTSPVMTERRWGRDARPARTERLRLETSTVPRAGAFGRADACRGVTRLR